MTICPPSRSGTLYIRSITEFRKKASFAVKQSQDALKSGAEPTLKTNCSRAVNHGRRSPKSLMSRKEKRRNMSTYKVNIPAGPLWSNDEAQKLGPLVAAAHQGKFTGQWNTVVEGQMSVVEVELNVQNAGKNEFKTFVLAGPIWSNDEAQKVGKTLAASYGAEFTGQWKTIVESVMSVIEIKYTF